MKYFLLFILSFFLLSAIGQSKLDSLNKALDLTSGKSRFEILYALTEELYKKDNDQALKLVKEALKIAEDYNDLHGQGDCLNYVGLIYRRKADYDSAIIFHKRALNIFISEKETEKIVWLYELLGRSQARIGDIDEALESFEKGLLYSHKEGYPERDENLFSEIGRIHTEKGNFDKAIEYYNRSLRISEDNSDKRYASATLDRIGILYGKMKEYSKSLEYLQKGLAIRKKINNIRGIAGSLNNIGNVHSHSGNYDSALYYFNEALNINRKEGMIIWQSYNLGNIGLVKKKQGLYNEALEYYFQSLKIKEEKDNKQGIVSTLRNISEVYAIKGELSKAIDCQLKSLDLAEKMGSKPGLLNCYTDLAEFFSRDGDYKNAFDYDQLYIALRDSVYNEEKVKTITEIQTKYETEKKDKENEILKRDAKIRKNLQVLLIVIISGLLLLSILLFLLFRIKNRSLKKNRQLFKQEKKLNDLEMKNREMEKQRLEELVFAEQKINGLQQDKIQNKNRELSTTTLHILNKNKILSEIKSEISGFSIDNESNDNTCKKITDLIDGNLVLDQDWEQFKLHFDEVHKGFFESLINDHPSLTENDLKLCAYLKINLSSKEIARIMNVTPNAIKKGRQRLRKKLQLEAEEDLMNYLNIN